MIFSSTIFLFIFLPICLLGYYLMQEKFRNIFLLIMSLLFYAWGQPQCVILLLASIVVNWIFGIAIDKKREQIKIRNVIVVFMLLYNLGTLFVFKYLAFTVTNVNLITGKEFTVPNLVLPIGISFFTFKAISYELDVLFGTAKVQKNIFNLALYLAFFPQVLSGPIVRYNSIENQLKKREESLGLFADGIKRFIAGLSKKIILSNMMASLSDLVFGMGYGDRTILLSWLGIIAYCLQLYYDFAGYSDMAIGIGKMFGFETEENFDFPYIAKSIGEFWRRWHISLSSWLRDYLYTPVFRSLLNRKNFITQKELSLQQSNVIALLITWTLAGAWHGANWNFILFGFYYALFIAGEKILEDYQKKKRKRLKLPKKKETRVESFFAHFYTLIAVMFGQLMFRSSGVTDACKSVGSMLGVYGNKFSNAYTGRLVWEYIVALLVCIIFCMPIAKWLRGKFEKKPVLCASLNVLEPIGYIVLFVVAISYTVTSTYNPFIYFKF